MKLSVIVPAHNEEKRIGRMLDEYLPYFTERYGEDVEFIVVVNGSTDNTDKVVKKYAADYPSLRCIVDTKKIGKGGALMKGFSEASGELIGFADADGATPPSAFNDLVDNIDDSDVIVASRWCSGAQVSPRQPWVRLMTSRAFNIMIRCMFGLRLTDTQCGAKLMRRDTLMRVMPELGLTQWAFDVDLLFHFRGAKGKIKEIPTVWRDIEGSKISALARTSFDMFLALVRLRLLHSPFKWIVALYDRFLAPLIRSEDDNGDRLIRHSMILMVGGQGANVCNLAFQLVMVRLLAGTGDYSELMSMLGVFSIISIPMGAMSRAVTHFTAHFIKDGERQRVIPMLVCCLRDICLVGMPLLVLVYFFRAGAAAFFTAFFHLDSSAPVLVLSAALVLAFCAPVLGGVLQGAQAFFWTTSISMIQALARVFFASVLVVAGYASLGALTGHALSVLCGLILGVTGVVKVIGIGNWRGERVNGFYAYVLPTMMSLAGYAVLMHADVVIVRHYFEVGDADLFAKAAMVARMVIFFPMPVALAMFPKVVSSGELSSSNWRILLKSITIVAFLVMSVAGFCTAFPTFVASVIVGSDDTALVPLIRGMVWALSPVSIIFLILNFELAQRRFIIALPMVISTIVYMVGVFLYHESLMQIVLVLAGVSLLGLFLSALCIPRHWLRGKPSSLASSI